MENNEQKWHMEREQNDLDTLVRDFTKIGPRPKSEVRRRLTKFLEMERTKQEKDAVYTQDVTPEDIKNVEHIKRTKETMFGKEAEKDYDIPPWWIAPEYSKAGMQDKDGFWHLDWDVEKIIKEAERRRKEIEVFAIAKQMSAFEISCCDKRVNKALNAVLEELGFDTRPAA